MAFIDSIKNYHISLANIDAGVYEDFSFRMARYEGEETSQVFLRIIAFLHSYQSGTRLINKDGLWLIELINEIGNYDIFAMIGVPDWRMLDQELKRRLSIKKVDTRQFSLYLTNAEDYQQLLSRIKSRKLHGLEALTVLTLKYDHDLVIDDEFIRADTWDVLILDDSMIQLAIKSKTSSTQLSVFVEKRDFWRDYQELLQGLIPVSV